MKGGQRHQTFSKSKSSSCRLTVSRYGHFCTLLRFAWGAGGAGAVVSLRFIVSGWCVACGVCCAIWFEHARKRSKRNVLRPRRRRRVRQRRNISATSRRRTCSAAEGKEAAHCPLCTVIDGIAHSTLSCASPHFLARQPCALCNTHHMLSVHWQGCLTVALHSKPHARSRNSRSRASRRLSAWTETSSSSIRTQWLPSQKQQ